MCVCYNVYTQKKLDCEAVVGRSPSVLLIDVTDSEFSTPKLTMASLQEIYNAE